MGCDEPGSSCLIGAFADIIMLYVINATENVMIRVKKKFPQPIFQDWIFMNLFCVLCGFMRAIWDFDDGKIWGFGKERRG